MKYGKLRIVWSAWLGILCLLTMALWVRSYWRLEILEKPIGSQAVQCSSVDGRIAIAHLKRTTIGRPYLNIVAGDAAEWRKKGVFRFAVHDDGFVTALIVPHWFAALLCAALAVIPWISRSWRFSLRTLLIAITLIAVALGTLIYWSG